MMPSMVCRGKRAVNVPRQRTSSKNPFQTDMGIAINSISQVAWGQSSRSLSKGAVRSREI